MIAIIQES